MDRLRHIFLMAAAAVAVFASDGPAGAQCRLCSTPTTELPTPSADSDVQLQVETSLSFDRLILSGNGPGAATIRPEGAKASEGAVMAVGPRATVGMVTVHGGPNRALRVELPRRIELFSLSGGRITLEDVTSDLPSSPRLDAAGNLSFRLGGRLIVNGDSDGQYRGDLSITVEYL
jgi:hypothetical protein